MDSLFFTHVTNTLIQKPSSLLSPTQWPPNLSLCQISPIHEATKAIFLKQRSNYDKKKPPTHKALVPPIKIK